MPDPFLREATLADLPALLALERACYPPNLAYTETEYEDYLTAPFAVNLVMVNDERELVAFAGGFTESPGVGHVYTVQVHPKTRGQGLARRLLKALEARLENAGAKRFRLEVGVANAEAIRLYESSGYERVGRLANYYAGDYENPDAYVYEKES